MCGSIRINTITPATGTRSIGTMNTNTSKSRTTIILNALRRQPESAYALATRVAKETKALTFVPTASVRRDIGALRTQGHDIENIGGLYRLTVPTPTGAPVW